MKMTRARERRGHRGNRICYSQTELEQLEKVFARSQYPDITVLHRISTDLRIPVDKICMWFQNRRAKFRKFSNQAHVDWMRNEIYTRTVVAPYLPSTSHGSGVLMQQTTVPSDISLSAAAQMSLASLSTTNPTDGGKPFLSTIKRSSPSNQHAFSLPNICVTTASATPQQGTTSTSERYYWNRLSNMASPHNGYMCNPCDYLKLPSSQGPSTSNAYTANMLEQHWGQAQKQQQWHLFQPTISEHHPFQQQDVKRSPGTTLSDKGLNLTNSTSLLPVTLNLATKSQSSKAYSSPSSSAIPESPCSTDLPSNEHIASCKSAPYDY